MKNRAKGRVGDEKLWENPTGLRTTHTLNYKIRPGQSRRPKIVKFLELLHRSVPCNAVFESNELKQHSPSYGRIIGDYLDWDSP